MKRQGADDAGRHAEMCQNGICRQPKCAEPPRKSLVITPQSPDCSEFQQPAKSYEKFQFILKDLRRFGIDVEALRTWSAIVDLRTGANYLKHGVGSSSKQTRIQEFLAQATSSKEAERLGDNENCLLSDVGPYFPKLPLTSSTDALTQEMLRSCIEDTCQFFFEIGKMHG